MCKGKFFGVFIISHKLVHREPKQNTYPFCRKLLSLDLIQIVWAGTTTEYLLLHNEIKVARIGARL